MTYTAFVNKLNFLYVRHLRSALYRADALNELDCARNGKVSDLPEGYVEELRYDLCGFDEDLMGIEREVYDLILEASKETWYDSFKSTHLQTYDLLKEDAHRIAPGEKRGVTGTGFSF